MHHHTGRLRTWVVVGTRGVHNSGEFAQNSGMEMEMDTTMEMDAVIENEQLLFGVDTKMCVDSIFDSGAGIGSDPQDYQAQNVGIQMEMNPGLEDELLRVAASVPATSPRTRSRMLSGEGAPGEFEIEAQWNRRNETQSFADSALQEASVIGALAESDVHVEVEEEWDDSDEDPPLLFANTPLTPKGNGMTPAG